MAKIENDLTQGKVFIKLLMFALPFLGSTVIQSLYNVADMLIVAQFCGVESISGVSIGGQMTFLLTNIVAGLSVGATVLIGQYVGSGNKEALKRVNATIITFLVVSALILTVLILFLKGNILRLIKTPAESYKEADSYLTATVSGLVFIFGYNAFSSMLRGMGNSKQPFYFIVVACVVSVLLDLVFVGMFKWGAFGAALATVIAQALSVFLCIFYMIKNNFNFDFKLRSFKIYGDQMKLILKIGFPTCIQNSVSSFSFMFITSIINTVGGVSASAAVGAVGRVNSFAFMPTMAISQSISAMSAQSFGAQKSERAVRALFIGIGFSVFITYAFFIFVRLYPDLIIRIFNSDPRMIQDGITYLSTFSFDLLLIPFVFCTNGFLIGGGHTLFTLTNSIISMILLRVPVCYFFGITLGFGLKGVGMGAPIASFGVIIILTIYMLTGRWKQNAVTYKKADKS